MGRPRGHVRQLGPDRWRLYVELDRDPLSGRRRQRTKVIAAANRRAAQDAWSEFAAEARSGTAPPAAGSDATVDELLDRWLDNHDVEASTKADWTDELRRYVRPHIGARAIAGVDAHTIDALYRKLERCGGKDGKALSGATVRHVHTCLRLAFAQAVRWRWIAVNPVLDARPPAVRATEVDPPDVAARAALLAAAAEMGPSWPVALRLAVVTGARRGELCGLQWGDLDLDAGTVTFRRVVRREGSTYVVAPRMKTAASRRTIALGAPTVAALRAWRRLAAERALAAGVGLADSSFVLSADPAGRTFRNPAAVTAKFTRIRERAGQPGVRLHDLRHAFATELLAAGVDVRTVAGRGGWANASVLLRTYAHFVPARDQAAAELLDGLLESGG